MRTHNHQRFTRKTIEQFVQDILQDYKPETIEELVKVLQRRFGVPHDDSIETIQGLIAEGELSIQKSEFTTPRNLAEYLKHPQYCWEALIILGPAIGIIPVVCLSETFPGFVLLSIFRAALGLVFLLFTTGFSLTTLLFPSDNDLDHIERVALSFGLSLAVAIIIGLILNYTWEIALFPILTSLVIMTLVVFILTVIIRIKGKSGSPYEVIE